MSKSLVGVVAVLAVIVLSGCDLFKGQQPLGLLSKRSRSC
jgi:uncharacterized lipoprotein